MSADEIIWHTNRWIMSTLQDPLAKPVWPQVSADLEEQLVAVLCNLLAPLGSVKDPASIPDLFAQVTVGFNSTMAAIEEHFEDGPKLEAIIVCRGDLEPMIYSPFGLASSAGQIRLVPLSKGSASKLSNASGRDATVIGIRSGVDSVLRLVRDIGCAQTSWAFNSPSLVSRKSQKATPKNKKSKSVA